MTITVKEKLVQVLVERGFFTTDAMYVINLAISEIEKQAADINGTQVNESGIKESISPYQITWDAPANDYPQIMYVLWYSQIVKRVALNWIIKNKPQAWFRPMFEKSAAEGFFVDKTFVDKTK